MAKAHCLPIDPSYLSWRVRRSLGQTIRFVEIANDVNEHNLNRRAKPVNGTKILLVSLSYKRNSGDARHSSRIMVAKQLRALDADLSACDPLIDPVEALDGIALVDYDEKALEWTDLIVLLADHDAFDYSLIEQRAARVLDTRNRLRHPNADRL